MCKNVNVQGNLETCHGLKVFPPADTARESFRKYDMRVKQEDMKLFHVWGELNERLERILEPVWYPEGDIDGREGGKGKVRQLSGLRITCGTHVPEVREERFRVSGRGRSV